MAKDIKSWYENLFSQKIQIAEWQLDVAAVIYVFLGLGLGLFIALSGVITDVFASVNASVIKDTDTHFSQGILSSTTVVGSGTGSYVELSSSGGGNWYNNSWQYRRKLTIDNSAQAENLANFPLLVTLSASNFDFSKVRSDGGDIRFTDSNGTTLLSYEIEEWDAVGQKAVIWVKVPQIDSSSDTDSIFLYYGNSGATSAASATNVWDSNYLYTFHLNEAYTNGATDAVKDSTATPRNGTATGFNGTSTSGTNLPSIIGDGVFFDGVNDSITIPSVGGGKNISVGAANTSYTVEVWYKWDGDTVNDKWLVTDGQLFWGFGDVAYALVVSSGYGSFMTASDNSIISFSNTPEVLSTTEWTYLVGVRDANDDSLKLYLNGQLVDTDADGTTAIDISSTEPVKLASRPGNDFYTYGPLDEPRLSNSIRSAAWIAAQYKSMMDQYIDYGDELVQLAPSGTWESATDSNVIDLLWNEAWGDGTAGSTAFSAEVSNVSGNATITFQMRAAATTGALAAAPYATLGTANSGTLFTRTAGDLLSYGLNTGNNRYVQLKATLVSVDGAANPRLGSITLHYQRDVDAPEVAPSALTMSRASGGAGILSGGWTNNPAAYFSWTHGSDSESGLKGYCAYLGSSAVGNPANDKGLLGTSPVSTDDTTCQFIVNANNIDFANSSLRGGGWLTTSSSNYYFILKAIDNSGNISATALSFPFKYDDLDPENPTFISLPGDFIQTKNATVTWPTNDGNAASDAHSGLAGLQYRIGSTGTWYGEDHTGAEDDTDLLEDDGAYTTDPTVDYPDISEGTNLIYVRTWDLAGNVSDSYVTGALKVNTIAPSAPTSLEVDPENNTTNSYAFNWEPPLTYSGQINNITYCYTVNVLPSVNTCSFTTPGTTELSADAYANQPGANVFYVVARDEASNINYEVYSQVEFTYSGSAPSLPLNVEVSDISIKESSSWRLVVSWDEPTGLGAGISRYDVFRSTTNVSCSSSFGSFAKIGTSASTSYTDNGLPQQTHYYCVKACDSANNCSAVSETKSGYPDGRFDVAPEIVTQPIVSDITTTKATISWSTNRSADSRVAFGLRSLDYFAEEPSKPVLTTSHSINLINLTPNTTYYFQAKWVDEDGNIGIASERLFRTLPAPTIKDVTTGNVGIDSALLRYTATNASSVRIYYGTSTAFGSVLTSGTTSAEQVYVSQLPNLLDGTKYYYRINPIDVEGNEYPGTVLDFTTIARPKIIDLKVNEVTGESQPTIRLNWSTNVETTNAIEYYPESDPSQLKQEASADYLKGVQEEVVRGLAPNTRYVLQLKVRDRLGNEVVSDKYTFITNEDSRPPKISNMRIEGSVVIAGIGGETTPTAQIVVSWDTDEPATSQIEYGQGTGGTYSQRSFKDGKLTYNHVVVISKLQPSKVYSLRVVTEDAARNETKSGDSVTITPKAGETATEIVLKNLSDIFGFL